MGLSGRQAPEHGLADRSGAGATVVVRIDADISDELAGAFPRLVVRQHRPTTTLTGEVADREELQGLLNLLHSLGITVLELMTIPDD